MQLVDTLKFEVPDSDWYFELRIPPLDVADAICAEFEAIEESRQAPMMALMGDESIGEMAEMTEDKLKKRPDLVAKLYKSGLRADEPRDVKTKLAGMIKPHVGQPVGLAGDGGGALTWEAAEQLNPAYIREVLFRAAEAVYSHCAGEAAGLASKNLNSSLPS